MQLLPFLPEPQQSVLDYIMELFDTDGAEPTAWLRTQIVWEHTGNIDPADRYINTFDIVNITNSAIDSSWTSTDVDEVRDGLLAMISGLRPLQAADLRCKELRHYLMYFNPITPVADRGPDWKDDPYGPSGPPFRIDTVGQPGTAVGVSLPAQIAVAHTEKTAYPRHWGRSYWPPLAVAAVDATGHYTTTAVNAVADAVKAGHDALIIDEKFPVVPVVQVDLEPFRGLLTVNQIQVDNVPDVQRRRRPNSTTFRAVRP